MTHAPTPSSCCSPRTPTPTSPSRRSTTSASTTTCSSRGTRPRSGCIPVLDDLLGDWRQANPDHDLRRAGRRAPLVRAQPRDQDLPGPQPRALPLARPRARRARRSGCTTRPAPAAADLPLVLRPRRRARCGRRRPSTSPARSGCAPRAEQPLYDLCIVGRRPGRARRRGLRGVGGAETVVVEREAPGRPGRPERGDRELPRVPEGAVRRRPHPPGGRPGAAVRRRDGARPRRRRASRRAGRCGPCASPDGGEIEARAVLVATGVSYRLLEAPGSAELTGRGVYYGATASEASQCRGRRRLRRRRGQLGRARPR